MDSADIFEIVYAQHIDWLNKYVPEKSNFIIGTCGNWDLATQLPREIINKKLKPNKYYRYFINVKAEYEYFYNKKAKGMVDMLNYLNFKLEGRHHSGIDDTKNIARIMIRMITDGHCWNNFKFTNANKKL